jgi:pyruvate ferredoxin oxidoreductase delta subunit
MNKISKVLKARKLSVSVFLAPITDEIGATKTGTWRTFMPVWKADLCKVCNICEKYCPDGVIAIVDKKVQIDYEYCKGCGICAYECPRHAIEMIEEPKGV